MLAMAAAAPKYRVSAGSIFVIFPPGNASRDRRYLGATRRRWSTRAAVLGRALIVLRFANQPPLHRWL
jgi:hypothetical protein